MMKTFAAGEFVIEVSDPHPCWVRIAYDGSLLTLRHDQIVDLQFVLERARQEVIRKLGPAYCDEVL
jgi:hypothetical protein